MKPTTEIKLGINLFVFRNFKEKSIDEICETIGISERKLLEIELGVFGVIDNNRDIINKIVDYYGIYLHTFLSEPIISLDYWRKNLKSIYFDEIKYFEKKYSQSVEKLREIKR